MERRFRCVSQVPPDLPPPPSERPPSSSILERLLAPPDVDFFARGISSAFGTAIRIRALLTVVSIELDFSFVYIGL